MDGEPIGKQTRRAANGHTPIEVNAANNKFGYVVFNNRANHPFQLSHSSFVFIGFFRFKSLYISPSNCENDCNFFVSKDACKCLHRHQSFIALQAHHSIYFQ
jgi:hypothetical protein